MGGENVFSAVNMLINTNRMHKRIIESRVTSLFGIHRSQHIILMHLAYSEKCRSQKMLAEHLNITPAAVTGALKKLECDGYIERSTAEDNRYNEIKITELGKKVVEETQALFAEIDESLFSGFSDRELQEFTGYLERIQNNMKKEQEEN